MRNTKSEQDYRVSNNLNVFLELFTGLLPTFSVECRSVAKRARSESDTPPNPVQCLLNADDVAALLIQLDRQDLQGWGLQLTSKLQAEASTVDVIAFESFFLPFLSALTTIVPWTSERVTRYRNLFRTTLQMLANRTPARQLDQQPPRLRLPQLSPTRPIPNQLITAIDSIPSQQQRKGPSAPDAKRHEHQARHGAIRLRNARGDEARHTLVGEARAVAGAVREG